MADILDAGNRAGLVARRSTVLRQKTQDGGIALQYGHACKRTRLGSRSALR